MEVRGDFISARGTLGNVTVDSSHAAMAYSAGVVDLTTVTARTYGGTLEGSGKVNLLSETPIWDMSCHVRRR